MSVNTEISSSLRTGLILLSSDNKTRIPPGKMVLTENIVVLLNLRVGHRDSEEDSRANGQGQRTLSR